jgi:hypothetical protein
MQITRKAVISRINRKLAKDTDEVLKVSRSARMKIDVGDFYLLDWRVNCVSGRDIDPETYARNLGVLKPFEQMVD